MGEGVELEKKKKEFHDASIEIVRLIDSGNIDTSIFGSGKFYREKVEKEKDSIYSNIDDMLNRSLNESEE